MWCQYTAYELVGDSRSRTESFGNGKRSQNASTQLAQELACICIRDLDLSRRKQPTGFWNF